MVDVNSMNVAAQAYRRATNMAESLQSSPLEPANQKEAALKPDFLDLVREGMNASMGNAYEGEIQSVKAMAKQTSLHDLVASVTNAELTLQTVVALRDRMITAYQDIQKMPI